VARSVAKYFSGEDLPIRLWYQGNTFINNSSYQGRLKEVTQVGAEFIGDDTVEGDGEMLALIVRLLKAAGLKEFQLSVGHVGFFKELIKAADLDEETIEELKALISNKNFFGVEELIDPLDLPQELKGLFHAMGVLYGSPDFPSPLMEMAAPYPKIDSVLKRLCELYDTLKLYEISDYVTIDLGSMSPFHYYTGIIFSGYTYGSGEPVVKGGRYDKLLSYFGKSAPSIGFAIEIEQLMATLTRQSIKVFVEQRCHLIVYHEKRRAQAISLAEKLRSGREEIMLLHWKEGKTNEDYLEYAHRMGLKDVTFIGE
jgi:ATP phosphoribosyltransferase regulatory subunit